MQEKQDYREHCSINESIPIFVKDWWLDQVCGENKWDVALVKKNDKIVASLPYYVRKNVLGQNSISMPALTQFMGPHITYPAKQKYTTRIAFEKHAILDLIKMLPRFSSYYQKFHYSITNWTPFYWEGFQQTTYYTTVIEDLSDLDKIYSSFEHEKRTDIRSGEGDLIIETSDDLAEFHRINTLTFKRQGLSPPYSFDFIKRIDEACKERGCREIFLAKDSSGRTHGAIYLIWDKMSSYSLMGGQDPEFKKSNSITLLAWEAIKKASKVTKKFDFEGSMMENVDRFNRGFGGKQVPYSSVKKNSGIEFLRNLKNKIRSP
jgi:lipid II:glycine glycyltransferase (peptidoglycan interpeptide bridge formation enzyme)